MIKSKKSLKGAKTPSRRKFFKVAAATGAAAATAVAMPNIATADGHVTLKMQAMRTLCGQEMISLSQSKTQFLAFGLRPNNQK